MSKSIPPAMLGALGTLIPTDTSNSTFGVFSDQSTLPARMSLDGLVTWLSAKMNQTDADIRSDMSRVNDAKDAEKKLHELISKLQTSMKGGAGGGDQLDVPADLADADKVHGSTLYQSLDPDGKKAIDAMLAKVQKQTVAAEDIPLTPPPFPIIIAKGTVLSPEDIAKNGLNSSQLTSKATMSKDDLDATIKSLTDTTSAISSNDEVAMIGLQTKISARAQLVQLVSNMISSVTDTNRNIIANCKGG